MQMSANTFYGTADKENHRGEAGQTTTQNTADNVEKKKESGGWIHRPSAKVRQTVHEQEEMVHHQDAKAQKAHEHHHCRLLWEEGSENKDEDHSDEGWGVEEDGFHEEEGTHISHPIFFVGHTDRISCAV